MQKPRLTRSGELDRIPELLRFVSLAAGYLVLAQLGIALAFVHGTAPPLWPATGLAIGALTLWGTRMWPAVAVGAFAGYFLFTPAGAAAAVGMAAGSAIEALLGAVLLRRLRVVGEVARIRDAVAIMAVAALAPIPAAVAGVSSFAAAGLLQGAEVLGVLSVWWLGHSMGALLVAPAMLAWFGTRGPALRPARPTEFASIVLTTLTILTLYFLSDADAGTGIATLPPGAVIFPPIFWAILRLRSREAILVFAAGCTMAVILTALRLSAESVAPLLGVQALVFSVGGGALAMLGGIIESIRAQADLLDSRERLAYALAAGRSGTFDWDVRTDQAEWSDEMLALYGLRREEFGGTMVDWLDLIAPEHRDAVRNAVKQSMQHGDFNLDFQIRRRDDGRLRWMAGRARVHFDASGRPLRVTGINMDITDRKTADLSLKASEAQLKAIVDHAPVGISYLLLPERRIQWVNLALCDITGYTPQELLTMTSFDITLPEDRWIAQDEYDWLAAGELRYFVFEKRYLRKDASVIWIRASVSAVYDESGKAVFAVNIVENITAAKLADDARRDAEQRLQLAVDIAELGSWEFHPGEDRLYISPSWKRRVGVELEDSGAEWRSRVHPDDRKRLADYLSNYLRHPEGPYQIEYRFRYGDGTYHWLSSRAVPVTDDDARLLKLIGTHLDVTDRKHAEQRIREESLHDPLTGLPNRGLITEYGAHLLGAAQRSHGYCAVLFIDLDRFKPINDTYGHETGDAVLKEVAQRLRSCTRREDLVGRLGGDEFLIVLPHVDYQHHRVDTVARHVLGVVSRPIQIDSLNLSVSPSIGVSYYPDHGSDMDTLIERADLAMYRAKEQGRANCQTYTPDLERRSEEAAERKSSLQAALMHGKLALYYQPIVNLRTGRLVAAEALLRMVQPDGQMVGPLSVLPTADSAELGADLDHWVLSDACRQHEAWLRQGLDPIVLSVNISSMQAMHPEFPDTVRDVVAKSGIDPLQLQLEVPGKALDGNGATSATFQQLKALGVRIALDGFGGGALNINQLTDLPIDCIKMEPSLVRRMATEPDATAAVSKLIVALGRILHLEIVAAGVESEETLRSLQEYGCEEAQGYYFSRPLPADDFARWYRQHQVH